MLRGAGGAHMVVKGLTFALSHNLQLRTDGEDYLFDTIDNNGNGDEEVWALEDKSKSCSYLRISNDVHRALFGKSESVNGETNRPVRRYFILAQNFIDFLRLHKQCNISKYQT